MNKRVVALDFDGVLHKYNGWNESRLDLPVEGALDSVNELLKRGLEVVVLTARPPAMVLHWLLEHGFPPLLVTNVKLPQISVFVDDRCIHFDGVWTTEIIDRIEVYEPYWRRV